MPDTTERCDTCAGTGEVCIHCGVCRKECECRTCSPVVCDDCDGYGENDLDE